MTSKRVIDLWIPYRKPSSRARLRLFCFPFAGGSASIFLNWYKMFPSEIEICPIQYPGREKRINESGFRSLKPLVTTLADILLPELDIPFAFFGHSMGALISFELACRLQKKDISPICLFLSSYCAPTIPKKETPIHLLPDREFLEKLHEYNGTPALVLQNDELMNLLLPALRADFAIHETYVHSPSNPLNCPISVFGGLEDPDVKYNDLELWKEQTTNSFSLQMFPGDHFYIRTSPEYVVNTILKQLQSNKNWLYG